MSDSELARVMVDYINRVEHLKNLVGRYVDGAGRGEIQEEMIRKMYKELKTEIREDADYLGLVRNYDGSTLYMGAFRPSIREAAAWGFTVPVNGRINQQFYSAVADAHYKLTKILSLEEWGEYM